MTTPKLYMATFDDRHTRIGQVGGYYFYWQEPRVGDTIYVTMAVKVSDLVQLTPVTVVPKDAVVIEGATAEELLQVVDMGRIHLEGNECGHGVAKRTLERIDAQLHLIRAFEEPKGYATLVRANENGFIARPKWQKNIANDLWNSDDGDINVKWSDLENPVISPKVGE